jgi:hypothetical protein
MFCCPTKGTDTMHDPKTAAFAAGAYCLGSHHLTGDHCLEIQGHKLHAVAPVIGE